MSNEEVWQQTTNKIIKTIDNLELEDEKENIIKICVEYMLVKMCENEQIFNENLLILDRYASNGKSKRPRRK